MVTRPVPIEMEYNIRKRRWEFVCTHPDGAMTATYLPQSRIQEMTEHQLYHELIRIGWTWREYYDEAQKPKG